MQQSENGSKASMERNGKENELFLIFSVSPGKGVERNTEKASNNLTCNTSMFPGRLWGE